MTMKEMADTPEEYLRVWRLNNIYAVPRRADEIDNVAAQCIKDAERNGIPLDALNEAAGGDLKNYIREAIASNNER